MAQDFYIDPATEDWALEGGTTIRMCDTHEELTRQRLEINLQMYRGEWFANLNYGVPYFQSVFGKNTKDEVDAIFKSTIRNTEGVIKITSFTSTTNSKTRGYSLVFSVVTTLGTIENIEVTV